MANGSFEHVLPAGTVRLGKEAEKVSLVPRWRWRVCQCVLDFVTVFGAALVSYSLYLQMGLGKQHFAPGFYVKVSVVLALFTVLGLQALGAYRRQAGMLQIETVRRVLKAAGGGLVLLLVASFMLKLPGFSRATVVMFFPAIVLTLVSQRIAVGWVQKRLRFFHRAKLPVVVYGAGETGRLLAQSLLDESHLGLAPVGFIDDDTEQMGEWVKVGAGHGGERIRLLGKEQDLKRVLDETGARAVLLAIPSASSERIAHLVRVLEELAVYYSFVPNAGNMLFSGLRWEEVAGMPMFTRRRPTRNPIYEMGKRLLDATVGAIALLLSLPILAVSMLLVKLTSPGPVFFSQERVGLNGRRFRILKLRTMHTDAPKYAKHPDHADDARVFAVGRWLRRLSIDELPQLWNVLSGEMSLVGPRPEMPFVVEGYSEIQRQRLAVKPGVTGPWQISPDRAFHIHENMQYDLYYVENREFMLDLAILLLTPFALLARNRAK